MTTTTDGLDEDGIKALVRRFYALALADDLLGPLFRDAIPDLEAHLPVIDDFWSHALLGTGRYSGTAYTHHTHLKVEEAHFDRWIAAFTQAAHETLPEWAAKKALARAAHMTQSFKMGLLPLPAPGKRTTA